MSRAAVAVRAIGWMILFVIALSVASLSVIYAWRYGLSFSSGGASPETTAAGFALFDVLKIVLLLVAAHLWINGTRYQAFMCSGLASVGVLMSLWAVFAMTAIDRAATDAKAIAKSTINYDLRAELSASERRVSELGDPAPLKAIEAELDGFKADSRWRTTAECNPLNVAPRSRRFCEALALKQAARERASEADRLRVRIFEIRERLQSDTAVNSTPASAELKLIATLTHGDPEKIGFLRALAVALAIEIVGAFAPGMLWMVRPTWPERNTERSPAPKVAATAPDLSPPPRTGGARRSATARRPRRRKRSTNILDFAQRFAERYGRPPNIPELRAHYPQLSKATLWRAAKSVSIETGKEFQMVI